MKPFKRAHLLSKPFLVFLFTLLCAVQFTSFGVSGPPWQGQANIAAAQSSQSIQIVRIDTSKHPRIEITVSVLDSSGRPLLGLTQDQFSVIEENSGQKVASFANITDQNIPLSIVLVIDTSKSMAGVPIERAKEAAASFVEQVRPIDELSLVEFNSTAKEVQPPTNDKAQIIAKIKTLQVGGQTALYDALAQAVNTASSAAIERRAIVLLTDGAEYGGLSKTAREEAYQLADKAGVPVFTIGLGYGMDEAYLSEVAQNTGGEFYRSPKPEDLTQVYGSIATLLRSLYVITFDTSLPADGSTHKIRVEFQGSSAEGNARYPAPIPVVKLKGIDPNTPLAIPAQVQADIVADNTITGFEYKIDGTSVSKGTGTSVPALTVDPEKLSPGKHSLELAVSDDKGHVGTGTLAFSVAALPPQFTIVGLNEGETVDADRKVSLAVQSSQTALGAADFSIDGTSVGTSNAEPYETIINVLSLEPDTHTFTAKLSNQGASAEKSLTFTIPSGPRQTATAASMQQTATAVQQTAIASALTATAEQLNRDQTATAIIQTNTAATATSMVAQTSTQQSIEASTQQAALRGTAAAQITGTASSLVTGTALVAQQVTQSAALTLAALPTATPRPTNTSLPTSTATNTTIPTNTATVTSTNTSLPTNTNTPQPTATNTATATFTTTFTATATFTATSTSTSTATFTPTATGTATPTATPVPLGDRIVNFAKSSSGATCAGAILLSIVILMILLGGRRGQQRPKPGDSDSTVPSKRGK